MLISERKYLFSINIQILWFYIIDLYVYQQRI